MAKGGSAEEVSGNGAEVPVSALAACGVDVVFANPGTTEMHVGGLDTARGAGER